MEAFDVPRYISRMRARFNNRAVGVRVRAGSVVVTTEMGANDEAEAGALMTVVTYLAGDSDALLALFDAPAVVDVNSIGVDTNPDAVQPSPPISPPSLMDESLGPNSDGQATAGSSDGIFVGWLLWLVVGLAVVASLLLLLLGCMCFSRPRRLCVLLCTHPDPTLGPLYVPDDVRQEYAMQLGLKQVPVDVWSYLLGRRGPPPTQLNGGIGVHTLPSEPGPCCSPRLLATSPLAPAPPIMLPPDAIAAELARSPRIPSPRTSPRAGPAASPASIFMSPMPPSLMDAAGAVCGGAAMFLDTAALAACPFDAMQPEKPVGGGLDGWDAGSSVAFLHEHKARSRSAGKSQRRLPLVHPPSPPSPSPGHRLSAARLERAVSDINTVNSSAGGPPRDTAAAAAATATATGAASPTVAATAASSHTPPPAQANQPGGLFLPPAALFLPAAALMADGGVAELDGRRRSESRLMHRRSSSGGIPSFRWCSRSGSGEASRGISPPHLASPMPRITTSGRLAAMPCGYPPGRQTPPGSHPPSGHSLGRETPPLPEPLLLPNAEMQVPACGGSADRTFGKRLKYLMQQALQPNSPKPMTAAEAAALWELRQTLYGSGDGSPAAVSGVCDSEELASRRAGLRPDELDGRASPRSELGASQSAFSEAQSGYSLQAQSEEPPLSPRSTISESAKSGTTANTGTTATDCRGALASLRMLAQHLPPASHHRSPSDPTAAAVALAVNLRTIGVREPPGGSSPPTATARRPPPLQPHVGVAQLQADDASFGFDQACPAATTGGADLHTQLQAAAAAQLQLCTHPATEVRSRPPRGAAAATAADQAAELEAAYAAGIQAAVLALPQAAAAPRSVVKPLRTPIGPQSGCSLLSGAGPSTGRPGLPPEGWRAPRLTLPATSLGPHVPTSQLPSPRHSPRNRASNKQPAPLSAAGTEAMKRVQRTRSITPLGTRLPTVPQSPNIKATVPTQPVPDGCTRGSSSSVPESLQSDDGIMMV